MFFSLEATIPCYAFKQSMTCVYVQIRGRHHRRTAVSVSDDLYKHGAGTGRCSSAGCGPGSCLNIAHVPLG